MDRRWLRVSILALGAAGLAACDDEFPTRPFDLHVADGPGVPRDFAVAVADLAQPDLHTPDDLAPAPDLSQVMCDLGGYATALLFLAAPGPGNALYTASFSGASWRGYPGSSSTTVDSVAITSAGQPARPLVVARRSDGAVVAAAFQPCLDAFDPLASIGGATGFRPSLVGGTVADLVYAGNGTDDLIYHAAFDGSTWGGPETQTTLHSKHAPAAARVQSALHALHVGLGTSGDLYDGVINASGGVGALVSTVMGGATTAHEPAALTLADGTLLVVFTGMNGSLFYTTRAPAAVAFAASTSLCAGLGGGCVISSNLAPVLGLDGNNKALVAYVGRDPMTATNNYRVFSTGFDGTKWTLPVEASGGEVTNLLPAVAAGVGSATVELVYVRASDGAARHARLIGTWQAPQQVGTTLVGAPALVKLP